MKAMTDRPILFSAEMVRAILDGRKTQTRRVMKVQPWPDALVTVEHYHPTVIDRHGDMQPGKEIFGAHWDDGEHGLRCPYGAPGDKLWVRETCWAESTFDGDGVRYPADHVWRIIENTQEASEAWCKLARYGGDAALDNETNIGKRVPSIHMPRWASRITLRITDIRAQRPQDISEDDARAEGCEGRPFPGPWWQGYRDLGDGEMFHQQAVGETAPDWMIEPKQMQPTPWLDQSARDGFRSIWMCLHGPGAWEANPWVWVVAFERVKP
jgi:hypothetical protein